MPCAGTSSENTPRAHDSRKTRSVLAQNTDFHDVVPYDVEARCLKVEVEEQILSEHGRSGAEELQMNSAMARPQQQRPVDIAPSIINHATLTRDTASLPCTRQSRTLRWRFELSHGCNSTDVCAAPGLCGCVDVWMGGWVDVWMGGWVDVWMCGWVDRWMGGWVDVWRRGTKTDTQD